MKLIWYTVLIRAIPETLGLILLTLAVVKEKRSFRDTFFVSVICGLIGFTMRMLPLKFGIHIILVAIIEAVIINVVLKISLHKVFLGIIVSLAVLTVTEIVTISFVEYVLKLNSQEVFSNAAGTLLAGLPSVLMLYIIAYIIYKFTNKTPYKDANFHVNQ